MVTYECMLNCCSIDSLLFLTGLNITQRAVSWKVYNFLVHIAWLCTQGSKNCIMILSLDHVNTILVSSHPWNLQLHRVCQILWSKPRAACTAARIGYKAISCSEPHWSQTAFSVSSYVGQSSNSKSEMCCFWNPKRLFRHCASVFVIGDAK